MYETGKTYQVATEMKNYNLTLLGVSETRWTQSGQKRLASGEMLLYSGHEEENAPHTQGVALMLSKEAQRALIGWEAHGPRIISASFRTKKRKIKMNVIQCYAPINDSDDSDKDQFYSRLQSIVEKYPERDITILMGDLNAKVGADNTGYEDIMGCHGLGQMNGNGERLADLCALNNLVIGGSVYPHKNIHKATWVSPNHTTENQIDHICINKKFRRSMQDVRVRRGVDVASDHHLLVARLKLKLKKNWEMAHSACQKYNTALLRDDSKQQEFKVSLSNRFQVLQDLLEEEGGTLESKWEGIKEAVIEICQEVLGPKKHQHKEWISADSLSNQEEEGKEDGHQ